MASLLPVGALLWLDATARACRIAAEEHALAEPWTPRASLLVDVALRSEELAGELLRLRAGAGWEAAA